MGNGFIKQRGTESKVNVVEKPTLRTNSLTNIPRYRSNGDVLPHRRINSIDNSNELDNNPISSDQCDVFDQLNVNQNQNNDLSGENLTEHDNYYSDFVETYNETGANCYIEIEIDSKLFRVSSENYMAIYLQRINQI